MKLKILFEFENRPQRKARCKHLVTAPGPTMYPFERSFDGFFCEKALTAGSDFLFWPNYI